MLGTSDDRRSAPVPHDHERRDDVQKVAKKRKGPGDSLRWLGYRGKSPSPLEICLTSLLAKLWLNWRSGLEQRCEASDCGCAPWRQISTWTEC